MAALELTISSVITKLLLLVGVVIATVCHRHLPANRSYVDGWVLANKQRQTVFVHVLKFIYNIFFHPLSSYPGPKLWAGSRLFLLKHELAGDLIFHTKRFHEKYGPVVRIAPTELSYNTSSALETIYGYRSVEMTKPVDGRGGLLPPPSAGLNLISADRANHARMRRNVSHAFSEQALRQQEPIIQEHITHFITRLRNRASSEAQDLCKWYTLVAFDIIAHLSFGESFDCLGREEYHPWVLSSLEASEAVPWNHIRLYYQLSGLWLRFIVPPKMREARRYNFNLAAEKMDRRLAITEERNDFTSYMLKYRDTEKGLTLLEMKNMGKSLTNAGSETIASVLGSATYCLLKNRSTYDKLAQEIRSSFNSESDITMIAVSELQYLTAVIKEALRLYPTIPSVLPRVVPGQGELIDGKWVPGNTAVGVPYYSAFRSKTNFHKPSSFVPERWLAEGSQEFKNDNKSVFQPFSFGPRNCIGQNLAYADIRLIMARMFFNFDLEFESKDCNWGEARVAPFVWQRLALMVKLTAR